MTVGARLRSKAASSLPRRGPRGRGRAEGDEDSIAIVEHLECEDEAAGAAESGLSGAGRASGAGRRHPGTRSARRVHFAVLPEHYEPLEEPAPGDKPRKRYRQKLKKYGKVGNRARRPRAANQGVVLAVGLRSAALGCPWAVPAQQHPSLQPKRSRGGAGRRYPAAGGLVTFVRGPCSVVMVSYVASPPRCNDGDPDASERLGDLEKPTQL
ncbi:hypothetical protein TREES_T100013797 [Tupaia chinensis]|uniref:Uncharacterized protein n=1 Tax=Tupaia chinensis TaxID=246437 RepID=L8Y4Z4_TUPCH|nr:hypothetical protein TREES_T100013797 [Tupaia chinensis]